MLWFKRIGVVFVMTLGLLPVFPLKAEAGLLDSVTGVVRKAVTPSSNPTKAASPESTPKPVPAQKPISAPSPTQVTPPKSEPAQKQEATAASTAPSEERTAGSRLLPDVHVKTPEIRVDTPLLKVEIPSVKTDVTADDGQQASVNLPAVQVDTPIVKIQAPTIEAVMPLALSNESPSPSIMITTPSVQIDTPVIGTASSAEAPLIKLDVPPVEVKVSTGELPQVSVQLPAVQVDTPIVRIRLGEGDGPQTPLEEPPIKVDSPAPENAPVQEDPIINHIPITPPQESNYTLPAENTGKKRPSGSKGNIGLPITRIIDESKEPAPEPNKESLPVAAPEAVNLEGGSASGLAPGKVTKDESIANPEPAINREAMVSVNPRDTLEDQSSASETIPLHNAPSYHWFAVLATGNGAVGNGEATSLNFGGGTSSGIGMLFPAQSQLLLPMQINNYERLQLISVNQWSKPPPNHPPQFMPLLNDQRTMRRSINRMEQRSLKVQEELTMLEQTIYEKQQQLYQAAEAHELTDPICLRHSMELDDLINAYNRLLKKTTR
jgi:hypothetical protein